MTGLKVGDRVKFLVGGQTYTGEMVFLGMGNRYATIALDNGDKLGWPGTPDDIDGGTDPDRRYWDVPIRDLEKVTSNGSIDKLFLASETEAGVVLSIKEANEVINHLKLLKETVDVAKWFLDEKELRLYMYYNLKGNKDSKEWEEFEAMDEKWCDLTARLQK